MAGCILIALTLDCPDSPFALKRCYTHQVFGERGRESDDTKHPSQPENAQKDILVVITKSTWGCAMRELRKVIGDGSVMVLT